MQMMHTCSNFTRPAHNHAIYVRAHGLQYDVSMMLLPLTACHDCFCLLPCNESANIEYLICYVCFKRRICFCYHQSHFATLLPCMLCSLAPKTAAALSCWYQTSVGWWQKQLCSGSLALPLLQLAGALLLLVVVVLVQQQHVCSCQRCFVRTSLVL